MKSSILALFLTLSLIGLPDAAHARKKANSDQSAVSTNANAPASAEAPQGAVDLNTASRDQIKALPGVGDKLADTIIQGRPYKSAQDLKNVKGIGDKKIEKLAPLVTVGAPGGTGSKTDTTTSKNSVSNEKLNTVNQNGPSTNSAANPAAASTSNHKKDMAPNEMININTASMEQLEALPGIGPKKAEAIIQARPFQTADDLMKVKGIKTATFSKIKDHITVR